MFKIIVSPNKTLHLEGEQSDDNINLFNMFSKGIGHGLLFLNTAHYLNKHLSEEERYASSKAGIDFSNYTSVRLQGSRSAIFFAL